MRKLFTLLLICISIGWWLFLSQMESIEKRYNKTGIIPEESTYHMYTIEHRALIYFTGCPLGYVDNFTNNFKNKFLLKTGQTTAYCDDKDDLRLEEIIRKLKQNKERFSNGSRLNQKKGR